MGLGYVLTAVDSQFQTQGVHLVSDAGDAIGEFVGVGDDAFGGGVAAGFYGPAVVDCLCQSTVLMGSGDKGGCGVLLIYSYPKSFNPKLTTSLAAVTILSASMSQLYAFHEFQPRAGVRPYN